MTIDVDAWGAGDEDTLRRRVDRSDPIDDVVEALCAVNGGHGLARRKLPSRERIGEAIGALHEALFPWHFGAIDVAREALPVFVRRAIETARRLLGAEIAVALAFTCGHAVDSCAVCARRAREITTAFLTRVPGLRALLETDAHAAHQGDPAATSADEAIHCYPGLTAIIHHRLAHELHGLGVPLVPRIIAERAHAATGIDLHPAARIGPSFFIDHGTGVVVGETCIIGARVRLYQGVTLGARSFPKDGNGHAAKGMPRHPIIEDDVVIYAGATVLGRITVGRGATIGGNVWLTHDVPPGAQLSQAQARQQTFDGGAGI